MKEKLASLAKSRYFIPTIMMIISLSILAYAVTSVSVNNSVTITSGASVLIVYQTTSFAGSCPTSGYVSSYSSPFPITEPAGSFTNTYVCIQNVGTGTDNPTIAITGVNPATCGTGGTSPCFSITTTPATLSPNPSGQIEGPITITITNGYSSAQASPIDLQITVT